MRLEPHEIEAIRQAGRELKTDVVLHERGHPLSLIVETAMEDGMVL